MNGPGETDLSAFERDVPCNKIEWARPQRDEYKGAKVVAKPVSLPAGKYKKLKRYKLVQKQHLRTEEYLANS